MPRNPNKIKCEHPDCKNWARQGYRLCAEHLRQKIERQHLADLPAPLQAALATLSKRREPTSDIDILNDELTKLFEARAIFLKWIQEQNARAGQPVTNPAKFMRAWNDSTAHVIKLIEARRRIRGPSDSLPNLLDEIQDEIAEALP